MIQDRVFSLIYRICAGVVILLGLLLKSVSVFDIKSNLIFYTQLSNILALGLMVSLVVANIISLKKNGRVGSASFFERAHATTCVIIFFTLLVYWCIIAPASIIKDISVFRFSNLALHLFSPILIILDNILFIKNGKLLKQDVFLMPLGPLVYFSAMYIFGAMGRICYYFEGQACNFPYMFMDYHIFGVYSFLIMGAIASLFVFTAFAFYKIDKRWHKKEIYFASKK